MFELQKPISFNLIPKTKITPTPKSPLSKSRMKKIIIKAEEQTIIEEPVVALPKPITTIFDPPGEIKKRGRPKKIAEEKVEVPPIEAEQKKRGRPKKVIEPIPAQKADETQP